MLRLDVLAPAAAVSWASAPKLKSLAEAETKVLNAAYEKAMKLRENSEQRSLIGIHLCRKGR